MVHRRSSTIQDCRYVLEVLRCIYQDQQNNCISTFPGTGATKAHILIPLLAFSNKELLSVPISRNCSCKLSTFSSGHKIH